MSSEEIKATIERLRSQHDGGYGYSLNDVACAFLGESHGMGVVPASKFRDALIALLEQADPETYLALPVDANGKPIHVGDELVTNHSKKTFVVTRLQYSRKHAWMVGGADKDDLSEYGLYAPRETRHYQPTVEDVLREFVNRVMSYNEDEDDGDAMISDCAAKLREVMS